MDRKRDTPPPGLSPEERDLWRQVAREVRPLKRRSAAAKPEAPKSEAPKSEVPKPPGEKTPRGAARPVRRPPGAPASINPPPELSHGTIADLDKRSAARLRRGLLRVEARLDLHGYTQAAAHRALDAFLADAQGAGKRCVLVITGKGTTSEGSGVLRAQVPRWLNQAPNRVRVLAFDYAQPRDGGMGALYVLLRRARD